MWRRSAALCLLAGVLWSAPTAAVQTERRAGEGLPSRSGAGGAVLAYEPEDGQRSIYQLDYQASAHADLRRMLEDQGGAESAESVAGGLLTYTFDTALSAELVVTTLSVQPTTVRYAYELRDPALRLVINGTDQVGQIGSLLRDLSRGFLVDMTTSGRVTAVHFDPATASPSRDLVLAVLGAIQCVLPEEAQSGSLSWSAEEEDRSGRYLAHYVAERPAAAPDGPAGGVLIITKRKAHYLPDGMDAPDGRAGGHTSVARTVSPSGELEIRFDTGAGRVTSIQGTESQDTAIAGEDVSHVESAVALRLAGSQVLAAGELAAVQERATSLGSRGVRSRLYAPPSAEEIQRSVQEATLGSETADSLIEKLRRAEASGQAEDRTALYLELKALVYLEPLSSDRLGKLLGIADVNGPTFDVLAGSLGAVGHPEAQRALITAMRARPEDWPAMANLIPTLAGAPEPTDEAVAWIRELAVTAQNRNVATTATLALGSMAQHLAGTDPARAASLVQELLRLLKSEEPEDQVATVLALGNTGSVLALPVLSKFVASPAPRLRAAALVALRSIPSPQVETLLLEGLRDVDDAVRLEAAYALGFRKMSSKAFTAQKAQFLVETSAEVRVALLTNLWSSRQEFPEARRLVEQASEEDASDHVRKVARSLLAQAR